MLKPLTTLEGIQRSEIRQLREENLDLKIKNLFLLKEVGQLNTLVNELQQGTARVAA